MLRRLELRRDVTSVTVLPDVGGKIASLVIGGREWLWKSDVLPWRAVTSADADVDASYVRTADSGGWDECFPTVGACQLESGVRLPDHGALWSQRATVELDEANDNISTRWRVPASWQPGENGNEAHGAHLDLERTIKITPAGTLRFTYRLMNTSSAPMPFLWSSHPLFPLASNMRIDLPRDARMRVWAAHGLPLPAAGDASTAHAWPFVTLDDGRTLDASNPTRSPFTQYACKLFIDVPDGDVEASLHDGEHSLRMRWRGSEIPNVGLWINHRGWTPFSDKEPYANVAFEPCIGAPDSLAAALGEWRAAHWLNANSTRTWSMELSAHTDMTMLTDAPR